MTNRDKFIKLYTDLIKRDGSDALLEYLKSENSDFFTAPASTRYHLSCEEGLLIHSMNVYECLKNYLARKEVKENFKLSYSDETIAIVSLLHDLCKVNCYKKGTRNVKDEFGKWQQVPTYEYDDKLPYGHGEKSVYIITGFMKLTREEAFAIRYHMGFSEAENARNVSSAYEMFPLALALSIADMEATYFVEER